MKKGICSIAMLMMVTVLMFGCASTPTLTPAQSELENAPDWVKDGGSSIEGGSASTGNAKIGAAGMNFARTEALAAARDELARQISIKVKNMTKSFTQSIGNGDAETVDRVSTQVSKQVANQTLQGSKQRSTWISPLNNLYVLVVIDENSLKNAVKNSVQTSFKNEQALWQEFLAKKAHEELNKEVEKEFGDHKNQ